MRRRCAEGVAQGDGEVKSGKLRGAQLIQNCEIMPGKNCEIMPGKKCEIMPGKNVKL
jgi:hypothetical protein